MVAVTGRTSRRVVARLPVAGKTQSSAVSMQSACSICGSFALSLCADEYKAAIGAEDGRAATRRVEVIIGMMRGRQRGAETVRSIEDRSGQPDEGV